MSAADELFAALELPPAAVVSVKITKKQLLAQKSPTAADKRQIRDGIESVRWIGSLKPQTVGIPEFTDDEAEYLELAVIQAELKPSADSARISRTLHRAVPYPVLLITETDDALVISVALKRRSRAQRDSFVLEGDGEVISADWSQPIEDPLWERFLEALALSKLPRTNLRALYRGWLGAIVAVRAARQGGRFAMPASETEATERLESLRAVERLSAEMAGLHSAAEKTNQKRRQVEINLKLAELRKDHHAALERVKIGDD